MEIRKEFVDLLFYVFSIFKKHQQTTWKEIPLSTICNFRKINNAAIELHAKDYLSKIVPLPSFIDNG